MMVEGGTFCGGGERSGCELTLRGGRRVMMSLRWWWSLEVKTDLRCDEESWHHIVVKQLALL